MYTYENIWPFLCFGIGLMISIVYHNVVINTRRKNYSVISKITAMKLLKNMRAKLCMTPIEESKEQNNESITLITTRSPRVNKTKSIDQSLRKQAEKELLKFTRNYLRNPALRPKVKITQRFLLQQFEDQFPKFIEVFSRDSEVVRKAWRLLPQKTRNMNGRPRKQSIPKT